MGRIRSLGGGLGLPPPIATPGAPRRRTSPVVVVRAKGWLLVLLREVGHRVVDVVDGVRAPQRVLARGGEECGGEGSGPPVGIGVGVEGRVRGTAALGRRRSTL